MTLRKRRSFIRPTITATLFIAVLLATSTSWSTEQAIGKQHTQQYVHFEYNQQRHYGLITPQTNNNTLDHSGSSIALLKGNIFQQPIKTGKIIPLSSVKLLPATTPSKIIAVGLNYSSHNSSRRGSKPKLFSKLNSAITGTQQPIWKYADADNLHFEGELVVVIGKEAKQIRVEDAPHYIFGVTVGNDVTERSWQSSDLQWLRGKGADSFAPVAPWISTGLNYNDLLVETRLNGKTLQSESTANLLFNVDEIVSYASQYFTLYPGDLIFTGTPGRTRAMKTGDIVEVTIEGIGTLSNTVTKR